jgi:hypothetical protein
MEIAVRGPLKVPARIENLGDVLNAARGLFGAALIKTVEVPDALIAPKSSDFALPARFVKLLKLRRRGTRMVRTGGGDTYFGIYEPVRLTVMERDCTVDVLKVPDGCPVLIGRTPLLLLDLTINGENLTGNPQHNGHWMSEMG